MSMVRHQHALVNWMHLSIWMQHAHKDGPEPVSRALHSTAGRVAGCKLCVRSQESSTTPLCNLHVRHLDKAGQCPALAWRQLLAAPCCRSQAMQLPHQTMECKWGLTVACTGRQRTVVLRSTAHACRRTCCPMCTCMRCMLGSAACSCPPMSSVGGQRACKGLGSSQLCSSHVRLQQLPHQCHHVAAVACTSAARSGWRKLSLMQQSSAASIGEGMPWIAAPTPVCHTLVCTGMSCVMCLPVMWLPVMRLPCCHGPWLHFLEHSLQLSEHRSLYCLPGKHSKSICALCFAHQPIMLTLCHITANVGDSGVTARHQTLLPFRQMMTSSGDLQRGLWEGSLGGGGGQPLANLLSFLR